MNGRVRPHNEADRARRHRPPPLIALSSLGIVSAWALSITGEHRRRHAGIALPSGATLPHTSDNRRRPLPYDNREPFNRSKAA
jgi:hypothetical protein